MMLLKLIVVHPFLKKRQKEDLVKIVRTDIELKNTPENGLDVWPVITKDNH